MRQTVASGVTFAHKSAKLSKSLDIRLKFNGIRQKLQKYCKNHINISRLQEVAKGMILWGGESPGGGISY